MLELYRDALRLRREHPALGDGSLTWLDAPVHALAFARRPGFVCLVNVADSPLSPPPGAELLLASADLVDGRVGTDTTAWFRL